MSKTSEKPFEEDPEGLKIDWVSDLAKIALLAEFIEIATKESCNCRVCQKLRERAQAFLALSKQIPKI
ncbi:MAG: hypothetical protein QXG39_10160 [Candidatus Aenigmatarchaeota archaeon]